MNFQVTVTNPASKPVPVDVRNQPIQVLPVLAISDSFTYIIRPNGNQPIANFGFLVPSDSMLEAISYYSAASPFLTLTLYAPASVPPAVLGAVQGAGIVPQSDTRFHFALSPTVTAGRSVIAFTTMTNMRINQVRLDVTVATLDGANIPATAAGELTFQFRK
jgi:hypothetical protein